jgi:hypothetical protein
MSNHSNNPYAAGQDPEGERFEIDALGGGRDLAEFEEPPRTSSLAVASLVSSLIFCCPLTTILGPVLGIAYFVGAAGKPWLRGRGLAIAGILLGVIFTIASGGLVWAVGNAFARLLQLPGEVMARIEQVDEGAVREFFMPGALPPGSDALRTFAAEVADRYGAFRSVMPDDRSSSVVMTGEIIPFPVRITFDAAEVEGVFQIAFPPGSMTPRVHSIEILDPQRGNLRLPPETSGRGGASGRRGEDADGTGMPPERTP